MSDVKTEDKSPETIKRYRLARPGDEGRACWVDASVDSLKRTIERGVKQTTTISGFYKDRAVTCDEFIWAACIVADEAPTPGEGYRLLKKLEYDGEEDEVREGDEVWRDGEWVGTVNHIHTHCKQSEGFHYRRRIEPDSLLQAKGSWCTQQPTGAPSLATGTELRVCQDIAARQAKGIAKYGTIVEANGLLLRACLEHAYEEALDSAVYLRRAMEEIDAQAKGEVTE